MAIVGLLFSFFKRLTEKYDYEEIFKKAMNYELLSEDEYNYYVKHTKGEPIKDYEAYMKIARLSPNDRERYFQEANENIKRKCPEAYDEITKIVKKSLDVDLENDKR